MKTKLIYSAVYIGKFICLAFLSVVISYCTTKEMKYEEGYIKTDDNIHLFYQKIGSGDQAVIIPLGFWLYDDFKHLANSNRTLVFYDMRNRHRSDYVEDTTAISIGKDVEDLEAIRQHLGFEKVSLIGESYLGMMVIRYAMEYPQHIDRVVQIGAVPYDHTQQFPDSLQYKETQVDSTDFAELNQLFREGYHEKNPKDFSIQYWNVVERVTLVADTSYLDQLGPQWGGHLEYENEWFPNFQRHLRYHFRSIQQLDHSPDNLVIVSQPVLTIHGTRDRNAPYGSGKEWSSLLPNAKLVTVKNAAHIPWIEQPELVFSSIDEFLDGNWPKVAKEVTK